MGLFNRIKNMLVDDVSEENEEQEINLNIDEDLKKDELNGDYLSGKSEKKVPERINKEEEVVVKKEEEKPAEIKKERDMQLINVNKAKTTKTKSNREKKEPQRSDVYVIPPVISPIYGCKEEKKVVKTTKKVVKHQDEEISDPLTTLISPFYGKKKNVDDQKNEKEDGVVKDVTLDKVIISKKEQHEVVINQEIDYVEVKDDTNNEVEVNYEDTSETIALKDLLGDSEVDDTQQISLFNNDSDDSDIDQKE